MSNIQLSAAPTQNNELEREEQEVLFLVEETQAYINEIVGRRSTLERAIAGLGAQGRDFVPSVTRTQHPQGLAQELRDAAAQSRAHVINARRQAVESLRSAVGQMTRRLGEIEGAIHRDLAETDRLMQERSKRARQEPPPRRAIPTAAPAHDERRETPRHSVCVEVGFQTEDNLYMGFSTDLSEGGVFVATVDLLPMGTSVDLTMSLPDGRTLNLRGQVRWIRDCQDRSPDINPGMGIQFVDLPNDVSVPLREFLRRRDPVFYAD